MLFGNVACDCLSNTGKPFLLWAIATMQCFLPSVCTTYTGFSQRLTDLEACLALLFFAVEAVGSGAAVNASSRNVNEAFFLVFFVFMGGAASVGGGSGGGGRGTKTSMSSLAGAAVKRGAAGNNET